MNEPYRDYPQHKALPTIVKIFPVVHLHRADVPSYHENKPFFLFRAAAKST